MVYLLIVFYLKDETLISSVTLITSITSTALSTLKTDHTVLESKFYKFKVLNTIFTDLVLKSNISGRSYNYCGTK